MAAFVQKGLKPRDKPRIVPQAGNAHIFEALRRSASPQHAGQPLHA
jgi:hypothetical protein